MTTADFLRSLEEIRDQFAWTLEPDSGAFAERRASPRLHIKGTSGTDSTVSLEPLHALCYVKTGEVFRPHAWVEIGKALDLSAIDVADIEAAGKNRTWRGVGGDRAPVAHLLALRIELLKAVGLDPSGLT